MTQFDPYSRPVARRRRANRRRERQPSGQNQSERQNDNRKKNSFLRGILYVFLAAALLFFGFAYLKNKNEQTRLQEFKLEQERAEQKHAQDLAYYSNMRSRSGIYDILQKYAQEYRLHPSFVSAIIARESHYDQYAQSSVGARGLMQIMEDTGSWIAKKLNVEEYSYDLLFDPDINIRFGCWYLSYLSNHYGGSPVMIASAYHAGMSNVNLWALRNADDGKTLSLEQIPKQDTKDYVQKVMNAYALYYEWDSSHNE